MYTHSNDNEFTMIDFDNRTDRFQLRPVKGWGGVGVRGRGHTYWTRGSSYRWKDYTPDRVVYP